MVPNAAFRTSASGCPHPVKGLSWRLWMRCCSFVRTWRWRAGRRQRLGGWSAGFGSPLAAWDT
eukprot:5758449-Alexandrium_andersonii.AAC.1